MIEQRKKILFLTHGFAVGGAETFLVNLLNNLDTQIIDPVVISLSEKLDLEPNLKNTIKVIKLVRRWKYDLSPANGLRNIILENNIDTFFVIGFYSFFFLNKALNNYKRNVKVIISLHSTKSRSLKEYIFSFLYTRMLKGNELLLTVSKNQADYLSKIYFIPRERFETIYNGVDINYWDLPTENFDIESFRKKLGIAKNDFVIIQVAAFRKEKKHKDSINALNILHKKYNLKAYLVFVGGGNDIIIQGCKKLVHKLNLLDYVKFCGVQNNVKPYYWISDLFTLSSTKIETLSIAALEAMACGLPCVLTNIGGASEMIIEGVNGYLAKPNDPSNLANLWFKVHENIDKFDKIKIRNIVREKFLLDRSVKNYLKYLLS